jgi:hypothetical protein
MIARSVICPVLANGHLSPIMLPQAKFALAPADVLMVVRGFANEENRMEETNKAIKHIAEWREKVT